MVIAPIRKNSICAMLPVKPASRDLGFRDERIKLAIRELIKSIFFNLNYNKKITLPSTSALNPNNTTYQNQNINNIGNPNLQPTIFDNYEVKWSAYDYAFIGYSLSSAKNQVIQRLNLNSNIVVNTNVNVPEVKVHNFNIGLPIPYMLFTKGLAETMKMNVNPDEMNFLFVSFF